MENAALIKELNRLTSYIHYYATLDIDDNSTD